MLLLRGQYLHDLHPFFTDLAFVFYSIFKELFMVVIRLARGGSKKRPFYNIVATDSRSRRDGRFIERVGFYNPVATKGESLRIAQDRLTYWQGVGAQLSPTVERLVKQSQQAQPAA